MVGDIKLHKLLWKKFKHHHYTLSELCWLCNGKVEIFQRFVQFHISNFDITLTQHINWTVFLIQMLVKKPYGTTAVKGHSWTFKFHKVVWQQKWGEVTTLLLPLPQFMIKCKSEQKLLKLNHTCQSYHKSRSGLVLSGTMCSNKKPPSSSSS